MGTSGIKNNYEAKTIGLLPAITIFFKFVIVFILDKYRIIIIQMSLIQTDCQVVMLLIRKIVTHTEVKHHS